MDKRTFLESAGLAGLVSMLCFDGLAQVFNSISDITPAELAGDEEFWAAVRKG
jgi:hypothetical protein